MNCDSDADDTETILPIKNKTKFKKTTMQRLQNLRWSDFMTIAVCAGIHYYFMTSFV